MRQIPERRRRAPLLAAVAAVAAVAFLAGCGDSGTDPLPDYDPRTSLDRLDAVLEPLDLGDEVFDGLWLATDALYAYGADPLFGGMLRVTGAGVLGEAVPDASTFRVLADGVRARLAASEAERAGSDGDVLPRLAFPSTLQGRTLVWDPGQAAYVVDPNRTDAPANGVRIEYYVTDGSGYPTSSATPLGHIDLTDRDQVLRERVGVRIVEYGATISQDRLIADYAVEMTVVGNASDGQLGFDTDGTVAGGGTAAGDALQMDLAQWFSWSDGQDYDRLLMDYEFDSWRGPLRLVVEAESRFEAASWERVEFGVTFGAGGTGTPQLALLIDQAGRLSGGIVQDGQTVIEVTGTDGNPQFRRPRGAALTSTEIATLEQIWIGVSDVITLVEWLGVPSDLLLLAG